MRLARRQKYAAMRNFRPLWNLGPTTATTITRNRPRKTDCVHEDLAKAITHTTARQIGDDIKDDSEVHFCMSRTGRLANIVSLNDDLKNVLFVRLGLRIVKLLLQVHMIYLLVFIQSCRRRVHKKGETYLTERRME